MSWFRFTDLFVSKKKKILREKTWEFFQKLCDAFEEAGDLLAISEEETRWVAKSFHDNARIWIRADGADGEIYIFVTRPIFQEAEYDEYLSHFLSCRRTNCVLYPEEWEKADERAIAKEFHELAQECRPVIEAIIKILGKAKKEQLEKVEREIDDLRQVSLSGM